MAKKNYYAVHKGRTVGVFGSWPECKESVDRFGGAIYKGFETRTEAELFSRTGEVSIPTKFYGVAKGRVTGVYTSWAKAKEQIDGVFLSKCQGFESIEAAKTYVANLRAVNAAQVPVFRSHFERFEDQRFKPDHSLPFLDQFDKLASSQNWSHGTQEWRERRTEAIESEFEFHFLAPLLDFKSEHAGSNNKGSDSQRLVCYQNLCKKLGKEDPQSIREARIILKARPWINIIDLIDSARTQEPIQTWDDFEEFRNYTSSSRKWINLQEAKKNEFLSALLVDFRDFHPSRTSNRACKGLDCDRGCCTSEDYEEDGTDEISDAEEEQEEFNEGKDEYDKENDKDDQDSGNGRQDEDDGDDSDDDYFETLEPKSKKLRLN